jgi:hypothetical protein
MSLTKFQIACGAELEVLLKRLNQQIHFWKIVHGQSEIYIEVHVGVLKMWVYEDGACWKGFGRSRVYEAIDFNSPDDLQQTFLQEVAAALQTKE